MIIKRFLGTFLLLAAAASGQTLTLVSGDGALVPAGAGIGSLPIVFLLTDANGPVSNATITFINTSGAFDTGLSPSKIVTDANGNAQTQFVPGTVFSPVQQYTLQASAPGSNIVTFHATTAQIPPTTTILTKPPSYPTYATTVDQPGTPITINVFGPSGPVRYISLSLKGIVSKTAPAGSLVQDIDCQVNGQNVTQVLTDSSGNASCTPVFHFANAALDATINGGYSFQVVVGGVILYGPFAYSVAPLPPSISAGPVQQVFVAGTPISASVTAINGTPPYTFSLVPTGGSLPSGVAFSANGLITGVATTPGIFPFVVQVTDKAGKTATSASLGLSLAISGGPFVIAPSALAGGLVGQPYSQTITVTGGVPPYTIGAAGSIPAGLKALPASNLGDQLSLTGTPTASGTFNISVAGFDATKQPFQGSVAITIAPSVTFTAPKLLPVFLGSPYLVPLVATGGLPPYNFTATGLPTGLTLSSDGVLSGTVPTSVSPGNKTIRVTVRDSVGGTAATDVIVSLATGPLNLESPMTLPTAIVGVPYSAQLTVPTGGVPPYSFTFAGTTPPTGVTLSQSGLLSGSFATDGAQTITYLLMDAAGQTATGTLEITVNPRGPAINAVVNSASFALGGVSPGELITLFGTGLGPVAGVSFSLDSLGNVPNTLAGVQVTIGTFKAPLLYVSQTQINAIVPFGLTLGDPVPIVVSFGGGTSVSAMVNLQSAAPGIFSIGGGQAAVLNTDFSVNRANNPAAKGSVVQIYATGAGAFTPPLADGQVPVAASSPSVPNVSVTIGGIEAAVSYAGAVPGLVAGVLAVNATVPAGVTASAAVPVILTIAGQSNAPQPVTISVGP